MEGEGEKEKSLVSRRARKATFRWLARASKHRSANHVPWSPMSEPASFEALIFLNLATMEKVPPFVARK